MSAALGLPGARPELVLLRDFPSGLMRSLGAEFELHRLWEAADRDAAIRRIATQVRGIVTGSLVGAFGRHSFRVASSLAAGLRRARHRLLRTAFGEGRTR